MSKRDDITSDRFGAAFVVKKGLLSAILFFIFIIAPAVMPAGFVSVGMLASVLICLVLSDFRIHKSILYLTGPMLIFILIGSLGSYHNAPYDVLKDIWYVANPLLAMFTGYFFMRAGGNLRNLFKMILAAAVVLAVVHISKFVANTDLIFEPVDTLRKTAGSGYFVTAIALMAMAVCHREKVRIASSPLLISVFIICSISIILSFSRTLWVSLVIMLLSAFGFFTFRNILKITVLGVVFAGLLIVLSLKPVTAQTDTDANFMGKMANSLKEMMIRNYVKQGDINRFWRGYESFCALKTYLNGSAIEYVTGRGFGTLVDLGIYIDLGGERLRYIPIFHNGYMFILVKTGIVGLVLYMYFFIRLIIYGKKYDKSTRTDPRMAGHFIVVLSTVIIVSTLVISGFFNKSDLLPVIMLLGAFVAVTGQKHDTGCPVAKAQAS